MGHLTHLIAKRQQNLQFQLGKGKVQVINEGSVSTRPGINLPLDSVDSQEVDLNEDEDGRTSAGLGGRGKWQEFFSRPPCFSRFLLSTKRWIGGSKITKPRKEKMKNC